MKKLDVPKIIQTEKIDLSQFSTNSRPSFITKKKQRRRGKGDVFPTGNNISNIEILIDLVTYFRKHILKLKNP